MTTLLVALAGGAVGTILTWLVAFAGRVAAVGREIAANDRALRVIDDHLETWVCDDTVRLRRELQEITNAINVVGGLNSGEHGVQIARAKERALHAYRDQERTAKSQAADIGAREGRLHGLVRAWRFKTLDLGLTAPESSVRYSMHGRRLSPAIWVRRIRPWRSTTRGSAQSRRSSPTSPMTRRR